MVARINLGRNMGALETSLERLSTGFKINSGKDDPAGLIASEMLRSDMTGIKTAIKNTERANMMIATADSALNEVTNLLNDIRGLVTEAANTGAMSAEMIAANQLQVDASLDAIDRIASQTTFMGLKLLDGSLDFDITGANRNDLQNLAVHQVTFGADKTPIDVNVTVRQAAEKAALYFNNPALAEEIVLQWGGNYGYSTQSFQRGATVAEIAQVVNASSDSTGVIAEVGSDAVPGTILTSSLGLNNDIIITAGKAGLNGGNVEIKYLKGTSEGITVKYEEPIDKNSPAKLLVYLQTEEYKNAVADDVDNTIFVNGQSIHDNNALKFEATIPGSQYNDANIHFVDGRFTQSSFGDPSDGSDPANPYGVAGHQYAYYNDEATVAKALFGDINGLSNIANLDGTDTYFTIQSKEAGSAYNNVAITFIEDTAGEVPAGKAVRARYDEVKNDDGTTSKTLKIYFKDGATIQQVQDALKLEGHFELTTSNSTVLGVALDSSSDSFDSAAAFDPTKDSPGGYGNTSNSGGEAGTLFIVMPSDGVDPVTNTSITANDIVAMFDPTHQASRGSERAADLFNVTRTVDNDGTGLIHLYSYEYTDANGNTTTQIPKTEFNKVFKDGVTGGNVITTAAELVTALNNSAYWGMEMCPELIAELAGYNAKGTYYDATTPPVITAKLAPGNFGNQVVAAFEEVAYYGNPNEGNALQFLGEKNSPNIRFVAEPGNSELRIDRTTVPDKVDFARAILTAQDPKASIIVTANEKGEAYDDVQFVYKRVSENPDSPYNPDDPADGLNPNRKNGWVEYDPGKSYAEAQATFKSTDGYDIANTAFYVTATERGDMFNNIPVQMTMSDTQAEAVKVVFDTKTNQLRVSLNSSMVNAPSTTDQNDPAWYPQITANDVIAAINKADLGFTAELSYSQNTSTMYDLTKPTDPTDVPPPLHPYEFLVDSNSNPYPVAYNDGSGTFEHLGLKVNQFTEVANTNETGGHLGGTVTVWMTDQETVDDAGNVTIRQPNANDATVLINNDQVVGKMFNARTYSSDPDSGKGLIDFAKDGPIVTSGGLVEKGAITVHLVTDESGLVKTTAKDLATWWDLQDPKTVDNISVSIVRPAGAVWDECNDPYGNGLLAPTISRGECDEWIINDIQFVGWNDNIEQQHLVLTKAKGTMTSDNGINASYDLVAKQNGPDYNGYTIVYSDDSTVTGYYADNYVEGSENNPCDDPEYTGLDKDNAGNLITPQTTSSKGMRLELDSNLKTITIHLRAGITTAYDIEQLIENDPQTRNIFEVLQHGDGTGVVSMQDDTLLTKDGALPAGELNGAKLLFGADATDYFLIFKSSEYGSDQFVDVQATTTGDTKTTFTLKDKNGNTAEKVYGQDVEALINGVQAVGRGLDVSLNTATLSLDMTLAEAVGTNTQYSTSFKITGGGATYQIGPDVVSNQQITLGIQSVNTVKLGGASGKMYQLRSGQNASLTNDTNKAFRIVEEAILAITSTRGRLGTMQKATFETNINVLNDTLEAITEAESQIRDTDFAEETANLTRAQILVQSNISTLGIANQIPNYMLGLLGG
jgi:flagellin-like hook-associated protein FlgL